MMNASDYNAQGVRIRSNIAIKRKSVRSKYLKLKPSLVIERKLMRKLNKIANNYFNVLGKQIAISVQSASESKLRLFGSKPLVDILRKFGAEISNDLTETGGEEERESKSNDLFELPPLLVDGVPVPLSKMTQSHLRAFIPLMLKYSTGRGKPGWGKSELRPEWWPSEMPWANVRVDARTDEMKREIPWTTALRKVIRNCYTHHGREDLLKNSEDFHARTSNFNPEYISYDDCLKSYPEISTEDIETRPVEEGNVPEEENAAEEIDASGNLQTTAPSEQTYYVYDTPPVVAPIYTFPLKVEMVNVVNLFTDIDPLAETNGRIEEISDEDLINATEEFCEEVMQNEDTSAYFPAIEDISRVSSSQDNKESYPLSSTGQDNKESLPVSSRSPDNKESYPAVEEITEEATPNTVGDQIDEEKPIWDTMGAEEVVVQDDSQYSNMEGCNLQSDIEGAPVVFVDDTMKIEYIVEENFHQSVVVVDGDCKEEDFFI